MTCRVFSWASSGLFSASGRPDSNHRRQCRQIYSLLPLATRATLRTCLRFLTSASDCDDELTRGLEPLTTCLQNRCSAIELRQPSRRGTRRLPSDALRQRVGKRARRLLLGHDLRKQDLAREVHQPMPRPSMRAGTVAKHLEFQGKMPDERDRKAHLSCGARPKRRVC